jgi:multidrug efflux pump subunit AcrA (membrane-fusion protein)
MTRDHSEPGPEHRSDGEVDPPHADVGAAPPVRPMESRRMLTIAATAAAVLVLLLIVTVLPRRSVEHELLAEAAARDSAPVVQVTTVHRAAAGSELTLPGTIQALHEGAIYARVPGYVRKWYADIGAVVRAGQVLADIDAPELEQNVQQARSQLAQTRASLGLARADLERWRVLARDSAVTGQELDQKRAAYDAAVANTGAAEANLRRLAQTREYTRVTAPFTGVVTARNVDLGSLITAAGGTSAPVAVGGGPGGASASGLFRLAQTDTVRTYVTVPETYASSIAPGLEADVSVQALANRHFTGHVVRTSRSLDPSSRTLLTEVDVANRDFALLPGMYAQVRLHFPRVTPPLLLPSSALVIRSSGSQVMVVEQGAGGATIRLRPVQIARDFGSSVELAGGVSEGQAVVLNPNADLVDGSKVRVAATSAAGGAGQAAAR